jgi:hypothetical protein
LDLVAFLKQRNKAVLYFYDNASKPFLEIVLAIENKAEPYVPVYSEDPEPQYLEEWEAAKNGLNAVGLTVASMLSSSVKLFLEEWVSRVEGHQRKYSRKHRKGWFFAYLKILKEVGVNIDDCPANMEIIEQLVLARNRAQHPENLTQIGVRHSGNDLKKYPNPYFISEDERKLLESRDLKSSWWLRPRVDFDHEKIETLIVEIESFCSWLDNEYWNARRA